MTVIDDHGRPEPPIAASSMTLGGMLKHLALVELWWFSEVLNGNERQPPWSEVDWNSDPDWDWHSSFDDSPDQLRGLWQETVDGSRSLTAAALRSGTGHADLLREAIDGETGE